MKRIRLSSSLDDNGYNWIGVILLTFFGKLFMHFCINIENYKNVSNWLLLISALFFLVYGIKYLTSSALFKDAIDFWERNKQMDDYKSRNKTISDQTNSNIKNKWILYIGPILAFLFLVSYPITKSSWLPSISSDSSKSHNLPRSHSKLTFDTYDRLADEYGFYSTQSDFLLSLIDSNKIYPSLVIDAQCCYGKTISLLNTCSTDSTIIKGCYFEN